MIYKLHRGCDFFYFTRDFIKYVSLMQRDIEPYTDILNVVRNVEISLFRTNYKILLTIIHIDIDDLINLI